jgi:lysylphosphatidylglycerol synthetase-like protein (DUF2156 family)
LWLAFAAATLVGGIPGIPDAGPAAAVMAALMLGNAAALALAGWWLGRRSRLAWLFALAVLLANTVLTFADQMGVWDWLVLALEVVMLALLVSVARSYVRTKPEQS